MSSPAAKHAHYLAVEIGPRPPTTSAEARAAQYCASVLEGAGLPTTIEPFQGLRSFGQTYIPIGAGFVAAALLAARRKAHRLTGFTVSAASLAAALGEASARAPLITERLAKGPSQNVVAKLEPTGEVRSKLVLAAHVDTTRSGLMFHPKLAKDFGRSGRIELGLAAALAGSWFLPRRIRRAIGIVSTAVFSYALGLMIQREVAGIDVVGANDNASGAGVMLALAETLALEPPAHTEVWFVATGCEESGLIGMQSFLDRHAIDLDDACFLGIDNVAGPGANVSWITESGLVEALPADRRLVELAEAVASENPEFEARPGQWRNILSDHDAALVAGRRAMMIAALTPEGTLPNWHWPTDTYDNVDENVLERCYGFTLGLVRKFDADS